MRKERVLEATLAYVRRTLEGEASGHDWWHIWRVRNLALRIGKEEGADLFIIELAALLHDIADWKFHGGDELKGSLVAEEWLTSLGVSQPIITHVQGILEIVSYKGAYVFAETLLTKEGQVVQDADRLDAIGAIGIARTFAYGGHAGREMHNPAIPPTLHRTAEAYKANTSPTINHFYEKLLLLKDRMHTQTARELAAERHRYMEEFLERFLREWDGEV
jgi:uncharacterized protein